LGAFGGPTSRAPARAPEIASEQISSGATTAARSFKTFISETFPIF
jgi:hypothetical protein